MTPCESCTYVPHATVTHGVRTSVFRVLSCPLGPFSHCPSGLSFPATPFSLCYLVLGLVCHPPCFSCLATLGISPLRCMWSISFKWRPHVGSAFVGSGTQRLSISSLSSRLLFVFRLHSDVPLYGCHGSFWQFSLCLLLHVGSVTLWCVLPATFSLLKWLCLWSLIF
jgi:hypothetical protein